MSENNIVLATLRFGQGRKWEVCKCEQARMDGFGRMPADFGDLRDLFQTAQKQITGPRRETRDNDDDKDGSGSALCCCQHGVPVLRSAGRYLRASSLLPRIQDAIIALPHTG